MLLSNMLKFSMGSTVVQFRKEYCEYRVDEDPGNRPITIRMLDATWTADIAADYILEMAEEPELNLFNLEKFFGMYQDDGEIVWEGDLKAEFLVDWLHRF